MNPTDDIFRLIQSLSREEKRYFRITSNRYSTHKNKNYLVLFDAIAGQSHYDEQALKAKLAEEPWVKHFTQEKNRLLNLLESTLRTYHAENTIEGRLKLLLIEADILRQRKLYQRSLKKLAQAEQLASKYDRFYILLEVNDITRSLTIEQRPKNLQKEIEQLILKREKVMQGLHLYTRYLNLYHRLAAYLRTHFRSREAEAETWLSSEDLSLLQEEPEAESFAIQKLYHQCRSFWFQSLNDTQGQYQENQAVVAWWEAHPDHCKEYYREFRKALTNLLHSCKETDKQGEIPPLLDKLKGIRELTPDDKGEAFQSYFLNKFLYHLNQKEWEQAKDLVPTIEKGLKKHRDKILEGWRIAFLTNLVILFFVLEDFEQAHKWLKTLKSERPKGHREDLDRYGELLNILIFYEKGEEDFAGNAARNFQEKLRRKGKLSAFEKSVLQTLQRLAGALPREKHNQFKQLQNVLQDLQKDPTQALAPGFEEVWLWVESRLSGKAMHQL